jgi:hypothetical protein
MPEKKGEDEGWVRYLEERTESMRHFRTFSLFACALSVAVLAGAPAVGQTKVVSHPPMRPLPAASNRPLEKGPGFFVDPLKGNDKQSGSEAQPWKTLGHAVGNLKPGDTLYLRGGTYYEHVVATCSGTADRPITVRSFPGELAILDGGLREFFEGPEKAWEPCPGGALGEFRSTRIFPNLGEKADSTNVLGNFGDSMVPLHGYRLRGDLQSTNMYWHDKVRTDKDASIYCGPGLYYDVQTRRIHIRLAHTTLKGLHDDNYRGETDPRKLRLVVAGRGSQPPLTLRGTRHVRVQDLVARGCVAATISVIDGRNLEFDGVTAYGGGAAIKVIDTAGLRVINTACRGIAAPWTFRGSLKYRAFEARIFSASGWAPTGADNRDFELAYSEFTDCVDGIFLGSVKNVKFHHNLVDNISDDGIFLTATTGFDGVTPGGDVHIYQNLLSRCLTTFAFGVGHGRQKTLPGGRRQTGSGVIVYRNVFDFRRPVMYHQPTSPDGPQEITSPGRFAGDHGGPAWEPMTVYHNTIIARHEKGYDYGTYGLSPRSSTNRLFNNIVVQLDKFPSIALLSAKSDFQVDHNLHWSVAQGQAADFLPKFQKSKVFEESKKQYAPGWTAHDRFADPKFVKFGSSWKEAVDLGLQAASPAIDAGLVLPKEWPDPLGALDKGKPDLGAVPLGAEPARVGVRGRLTQFGAKAKKEPIDLPASTWAPFKPVAPKSAGRKPAAFIEGYPEIDAPLIRFALRKQGLELDDRGHSWLGPKEYSKYSVVVLAGDLQRAQIKPNVFAADDLADVRKYLEQGGTLWLTGRAKRVFDWSPAGQEFLQALTAPGPVTPNGKIAIQKPGHPWVKHLSPTETYAWLTPPKDTDIRPWRASKGEPIIASSDGTCLLYRLQVGKGQLIYMGWRAMAALPQGRTQATEAQEKAFAEQAQILFHIVAELAARDAKTPPR